MKAGNKTAFAATATTRVGVRGRRAPPKPKGEIVGKADSI